MKTYTYDVLDPTLRSYTENTFLCVLFYFKTFWLIGSLMLILGKEDSTNCNYFPTTLPLKVIAWDLNSSPP
jgi:hypothetical protein